MLYKIIPELIYGENEESLEMVTGKLLTARKGSLALLRAVPVER